MAMKSRIIIDDEMDDIDLASMVIQRSTAIRRRKRWEALLEIPGFKERTENPRNALEGDIIQIYRIGPNGDEISFGKLTADAFNDEVRGVAGTYYRVAPLHYGYEFYIRSDLDIVDNSFGHGHIFWPIQPGDRGVYKVEIIGTVEYPGLGLK